MLEHKLPDHISVPLDQAAYDKVLMNKTAEASYLLMACLRKEPLMVLNSQLESAGTEPVYAMPSSFVLANQLLFNEDCSQRVCAICSNESQLDLAVVEND